MAEVLQEMTATNVRPDLITPGTLELRWLSVRFSTLIKGYCSNGELSKACFKWLPSPLQAMRLQEELQARQLECDAGSSEL